MARSGDFEARWATTPGFARRRRHGPPLCEPARDFQGWTVAMLAALGASPTPGAINHAKLALQAEYDTRRATLPADHRGPPRRHRCLEAIHADAYRTLTALWAPRDPRHRADAR